MSPRARLRQIQAHPSDVCFLVEDDLAALLLGGHALFPHVQACVEGELLFRVWLTQDNCPPCVREALKHGNAGTSGAVSWFHKNDARTFDRTFFETTLKLASRIVQDGTDSIQFFEERVRAFKNAHGIIPVVDAAGNAFPVPFQLEQGSQTEENRILDAAGRRVDGWEACAAGLWAALGNGGWRLNLRCHQPGASSPFVGGSFALPVWIAAHFRNREVRALDWLATGAISEGRLNPVESLEQKSALATRMGAKLWLTVAQEEAVPGVLALPTGMPHSEALGHVEAAMEEHGLGPLSEASIMLQLATLGVQIRRKKVPYDVARTRAKKWYAWLKAQGKHDRPAYLRTLILLAEIDNHTGHAAHANDYFREIQSGSWRHSALDRFRALNHFIVSLSDQMRLDEAEAVATDLLQTLNTATFETEESYLRSENSLFGVLGGEVKLFKALGGEPCQADARAYLAKSSEAALHLIKNCGSTDAHRFEYSKTAVRQALWVALFEPAKMAAATTAVEAELQSLNAADPVSLQYLRRHRFLAAYRLWKLHGTVEQGYAELPLAQNSGGFDAWLRATSLKYRATLHAVSGHYTEAEIDFHAAAALFGKEDGPVLRLIRASILLQANELFADAGRATPFSAQDLAAAFAAIPARSFDPEFLAKWQRRLKGDRSVDPQRAFAY